MAYPQATFSMTKFEPGSFLDKRRTTVRTSTLLYQLQMLKDTGRYDAFKLQRHPSYDDPPTVWPVPNHLFWDSDVAKWIEGACYSLYDEKNVQVESAIHELVAMIASAQGSDGYLNIHFTVVEPNKRFTNLRDLHELTREFLDVVCKYVKLLSTVFGPNTGQKHGYPGHPEIELALLRLYEVTKDDTHLSLARYFIQERGNASGEHYFDMEARARGERENEMPKYYPERRSYWYQQAHKPILEQDTVEGHSVRAMYLLTAVADLVRLDPAATEYRSTLSTLWENMVGKKMYVTGGIGAIAQWEGFGLDYFLPQDTPEGGCYAETCAAIGIMMLAERLLQLDLSGHYADVMELALYNAVLTGMSLDGTKFTYVNQMASSDGNLSERHGWFECACCPPNVTRVLGCIGGYIWTPSAESISIHMYTAATLQCGDTTLKMATDWPWSGRIDFSCNNAVELRLRIPAWATSWRLTDSSGQLVQAEVKNGYIRLSKGFVKENPTMSLDIPLVPRIIRTHPYASSQTLSIARGPVVYCLEDKDNAWVEDHFRSTVLIADAQLKETSRKDQQNGEPYVAITAVQGGTELDLQARRPDQILTPQVPSYSPKLRDLNFIPYYYRANRGGHGMMRVGLREKLHRS